ncbi:MAG: class I SAM-dependent methyltransferase [Gemmatimonadaceae bacterium]
MRRGIESINRDASDRSNFLYGNILEQKRYIFPLDRVRGLDVLDCASGIGWGTFLAASAGARRVVGVELSRDAVTSARKYYSGENIEYINSALASSALPDGSFDVILSFETLEHVGEPVEFLQKLRSLAKREATMFLSTPNGYVFKQQGQEPHNPFHFDEYTRQELNEMFAKAGWVVVEYRGQYPMTRGSEEIAAYGKYIKAYWSQLKRVATFGVPYRFLTLVRRHLGLGLVEPAYGSSCDPVLIDGGQEPAYHYFILAPGRSQ